jgi:hypothetical protein
VGPHGRTWLIERSNPARRSRLMTTHTCISEARAILKAASLLTVAAWVKRTVDRLSTTRWFDRAILQGKGPSAPTPASASSVTSLSTAHYGSGNIYVPGWGRLYYRKALKTRDGHVLYDHDSMLNSYHIGPCPLLRTDTNCEECIWHVDGGRYRYDPQCAALVRVNEMAEGDTFGLTDTKRALEQSL